MDRWKSRGGKSQRGEEKKRENQRGEKVRRKKRQARAKVEKSRFANLLCFPMIGGSGGSKSRLATAAGAEPCRQMEMKRCTPLWREANLEVIKTPHVRTTFGIEKAHAVEQQQQQQQQQHHHHHHHHHHQQQQQQQQGRHQQQQRQQQDDSSSGSRSDSGAGRCRREEKEGAIGRSKKSEQKERV